MYDKIILISGPTASGKSKLAIDLAKKFSGEIINADSMQVYKEIKILSARPIKLEKIKHHFFGFISAKQNFSTGEWLQLVEKKIREVHDRKKIPIIVGGTGLYFKALINGMAKIPAISKNIRNKTIQLHKKLGNELFYEKLIILDPKCKNIIQPTDPQRMIRAYEVFVHTKKSIQDWKKETKSKFNNKQFVKILLCPEKIILHEKIEKRSKLMISTKTEREVKQFLQLKINTLLPANFIIGIKEFKDYFAKIITKEKLIELIIIRTKQYAKRQFTWQRGQMSDWNQFFDQDYQKLFKKVSNLLSKT